MPKQRRQQPKKRKSPLIRTDKWQLHPSNQQRTLLENTVTEYRRLVRGLIGVVYTHWVEIAQAKDPLKVVESLIHATGNRPDVKYTYFGRAFYKFPSYLRRAAIHNAIGQVSSFVTRYDRWQRGIRSRRDAKPPRLTADTGVYPSLYQGQCILFKANFSSARIKVFTGKDWVWTDPIPVTEHRDRHKVEVNQPKSPQLVVSGKKCHLSQPFQVNPNTRSDSEKVLAVDLGLNTTATVAVVDSHGTVMHRQFIHPGKDIDRRDKRLKRISKKASLTGKLSRGFGKGLYRKANHINQQIAQKVSTAIVRLAVRFNVKAIVFERLKGWRPKGGKKRSNLKQRFHGWLHRRTAELTEMKWAELGGAVDYINPAYTSKYAYDGSGVVQRDKENYALATFKTGKKYSADLNAAYNIAARYWYKILKLGSRNGSEVWLNQSSSQTPRTPVTLSVLWVTTTTLVER